MTTYDPQTKRLLRESEMRREMILDSIRELEASRIEIMRQYWPGAVPPELLRDINAMIVSLQGQLLEIDRVRS
jgi:hypothetical protein